MKQLLIKLCYSIIGITNVYAVDNNLILIGTTGDYPPLTYRTESGYRGKDIEIIMGFAKTEHLVIKFIPTTWQTISQDLSSGKFDAAIGGVSETPARKQLFYLSDAIESSAKVPLIRCSDSNRFTSFASIDSESIVVVENRGGTNQDFALQHIKHAALILYPQNYKALDSLNQTKTLADVMFTDDVEVQYRHKINPQLCLANIPEKFPSSNKVFLFAKTNKGQELNKLFNSWWQLNKLSY
jgi:cyclohexadienyl dehydratase